MVRYEKNANMIKPSFNRLIVGGILLTPEFPPPTKSGSIVSKIKGIESKRLSLAMYSKQLQPIAPCPTPDACRPYYRDPLLNH